MHTQIIEKKRFSVIGKLGSTEQGDGWIAALWKGANAHFGEVAALAKKDENGNFCGCWGAMSDKNMQFQPWEDDFSKGLYLAGIECTDEAEVPSGWVKWTIPAFRFVRIECTDADTFPQGLAYLQENGYSLAGAVQDYTEIATGKNYMCFPIERI